MILIKPFNFGKLLFFKSKKEKAALGDIAITKIGEGKVQSITTTALDNIAVNTAKLQSDKKEISVENSITKTGEGKFQNITTTTLDSIKVNTAKPQSNKMEKKRSEDISITKTEEGKVQSITATTLDEVDANTIKRESPLLPISEEPNLTTGDKLIISKELLDEKVMSPEKNPITEMESLEIQNVKDTEVESTLFEPTKINCTTEDELAVSERLQDIPDETDININEAKKSTELEVKQSPNGERWAISSPDVDFTAIWKIDISDNFKDGYDEYLKGLGQPSIVRAVALSIIDLTTEDINQSNEGREVSIKGKNIRGIWERTLVASGSDYEKEYSENENRESIFILTADNEKVTAEAWWEMNGTIHVSWLRGGKKYGGGDFESRRYLADGGKTLVCESIFYPKKKNKGKPSLTWKFTRVENEA